MNFLKALLILLTTCAFVASAKSQSYSLQHQPAKYVNKSLYENIDFGPNTNRSDQVWIAFVAKNNVTAYKKSDAEKPLKQLTFKEWYYVVNEEGDYLELVKANREDVFEKRVKNAEEVGWVKKSNLLLWNTCFMDSERKSFVKVLFRPNDSAFSNIKSHDFYSSASSREKYKIDSSYQNQEFYYILQKKGDYFLLSRTPEINSLTGESSILGWVHNSKLWVWNTRFTVASKEADKLIHKKFFPDLQDATSLEFDMKFLPLGIDSDGKKSLYTTYREEEYIHVVNYDSLYSDSTIAHFTVLSDIEINNAIDELECLDFRGLSFEEMELAIQKVRDESQPRVKPLYDKNMYKAIEAISCVVTPESEFQNLILGEIINLAPDDKKISDYHRYLDSILKKLRHSRKENDKILETPYINWYFVPLN